MMPRRRDMLLLLALGTLLPAAPVLAAAEPPRLKVVASFSILGDMVREVGGERVALTTLVGPDGDGHVYEPSPADARTLRAADLVVMSGLGFEGWLPRLVEAAGFKGPLVTASEGIRPLTQGGEPDPHAWQDLEHGMSYVRTIAAALAAADPAGAGLYRANAEAYAARLADLDRELETAFARLPPERRRLVTSHDAFGYFAAAYGLTVLAPEGVSTESEASAADVAALIRQIRREAIPAVFLENVSDPRLLAQIVRETGAAIGGTLYSDALSGPDGPAPTYEAMFRHNMEVLVAALAA